MKTSKTGIELLMFFEGYRSKAYQCDADRWTIGYGTTIYPNGVPVKKGDTCTKEQAMLFVFSDVLPIEKTISELVTVTLNQNQYDALVCLIYNIGRSAFTGSTMRKLLNKGDLQKAAMEFPKWNKVKKVVNEGLTKRRLKEQTLFNTPIN